MTTIDSAHQQTARQVRPNSAWYCYRARQQLKQLTADRIAEGEHLAGKDIDFVERETGMCQTWRVLEIGCGWGRHSLELARRGYQQVSSLDVSPDLATYARHYAAGAGHRLTIECLDYLDYQSDTAFDIILSLYDRSCLGQPDEQQDQASLTHLAGLLRPGGYLVFGIRDWPLDLPRPGRSWEETEEGIELHEVLVNSSNMRCTHRLMLVRPDGSREVYELTRRHYHLPEVRQRLRAAGFHLLSAYHAYDLTRAYGSEPQGLVVVAQMAPSSEVPEEPEGVKHATHS